MKEELIKTLGRVNLKKKELHEEVNNAATALYEELKNTEGCKVSFVPGVFWKTKIGEKRAIEPDAIVDESVGVLCRDEDGKPVSGFVKEIFIAEDGIKVSVVPVEGGISPDPVVFAAEDVDNVDALVDFVIRFKYAERA